MFVRISLQLNGKNISLSGRGNKAFKVDFDLLKMASPRFKRLLKQIVIKVLGIIKVVTDGLHSLRIICSAAWSQP